MFYLLLGLFLFSLFFESALASCFSTMELFVKPHHFLESIPPALRVATISTALWRISFSSSSSIASQISETFLKDVVPMPKIFWRKSLEVVRPAILLVVAETTTIEE